MIELNNTDRTQEGNNSGAMVTTLTTVPSPQWPIDTDVIYVNGTNRLKLSVQPRVLQKFFHTAFENLRKGLVFYHAFPNPTTLPRMLRKAVTDAAEIHTYVDGRYDSSAACVHQRILTDVEYETQMVKLVSIITSRKT
jgi:hypothetical protein